MSCPRLTLGEAVRLLLFGGAALLRVSDNLYEVVRARPVTLARQDSGLEVLGMVDLSDFPELAE